MKEKKKHEAMNEIKKNLGIMFYIQLINLDLMILREYLKMYQMMKD